MSGRASQERKALELTFLSQLHSSLQACCIHLMINSSYLANFEMVQLGGKKRYAPQLTFLFRILVYNLSSPCSASVSNESS